MIYDYKKDTKILILFALFNYMHLTPTAFKMLMTGGDFINDIITAPLPLAIWEVGFFLSWFLPTIYFLLYILTKSKNLRKIFNKKYLFLYLITSYIFLTPLYLINFYTAIFSSIDRTLLMEGKFGLPQTYSSVLVFLSMSIYFISGSYRSDSKKSDDV